MIFDIKRYKYKFKSEIQIFIYQVFKVMSLQKRLNNYVVKTTNLIRAKFTQNPALANTLRATGQKKIAESGKHRFFAVGLPITHKDILNQNVWNGESMLGEILMTVRNELNQDQ